MLQIQNQTTQNIDTKRLHEVYKSLSDKELELIFVNDKTIQEINHQYRGKNYPTDVLSFPLENIPHAPIGTIMISVDEALRVSKDLKHSFDDEILLLFIHGFLHISGYDHEKDSGEMREKEKSLIEKFNLPKSLIIRTLEP